MRKQKRGAQVLPCLKGPVQLYLKKDKGRTSTLTLIKSLGYA